MKAYMIIYIIIISVFIGAIELPDNSLSQSFLNNPGHFSFSTGITGNFNHSAVYSLFSYSNIQALNKNWFIDYNINYLNYDKSNNYATTGIGLNYKNDNFLFQIYISKTFDDNDLYRLKYLTKNQ